MILDRSDLTLMADRHLWLLGLMVKAALGLFLGKSEPTFRLGDSREWWRLRHDVAHTN